MLAQTVLTESMVLTEPTVPMEAMEVTVATAELGVELAATVAMVATVVMRSHDHAASPMAFPEKL